MFYSVESGRCEMCPMAYYQDQIGQLECKYCGVQFTTVHVRSMSQLDCIGMWKYLRYYLHKSGGWIQNFYIGDSNLLKMV